MPTSSTSPSVIIRDYIESQIKSLDQFDDNLPQRIVTQFRYNPTIALCSSSDEPVQYLIDGDFDLELNGSTQKTIKLTIGNCTRYYTQEGEFIKIG